MNTTITNKDIIIENPDQETIDRLENQLTYIDKGKSFRISQLRKKIKANRGNPWYINNGIIQKMEAELEKLKGDERGTLFTWDNGNILVPSGFLNLVNPVNPSDMRTDTGDKKFFPWKNKPEHDMRDYQIEAVELAKNNYRGIINLATGLGKTLVIVHLIREIGRKSLIIVPNKNLAKQFYNDLCHLFGSDRVGMFGGGKKQVRDITVGIAASVTRNTELFMDCGLIAGDECLPYRERINTEIGPKEIGWLVRQSEHGRELPKVLSLNESNNTFEYKKITNVWRKKRKELVEIKYSKRRFHCTPNHKILTKDGWKAAGEIKKGDFIIGVPGKKQQHDIIRVFNEDQFQFILGSYLGNGSINDVGSGRYRLNFTHDMQQKEYALWKKWLIDGTSVEISHNSYCQKPAIRISSKCFDLEHELGKKTYCPQWVIDKMDVRALAVWFMDDGSVYRDGCGASIATCSFDEDSNSRLSDKLTSMGIENHYKFTKYISKRESGYFKIVISSKGYKKLVELIAPYIHENMSYKVLFNNIGTYKWNNNFKDYGYGLVECVKPIENKTMKGRQPYVFDIEVEDNHNFIICSGTNECGIVAHNCQHTPASTFYSITRDLGHVGRIYGFTATAYRTDGKDIFITAGCGDILINRDAKWGIENSYLAKPYFYVRKIRNTGSYEGDDKLKHYKNHVLNSKVTKRQITNDMKKMIGAGKNVLCLVDMVEHGRELSKDLNIPFVTGEDSDSYSYVEEFDKGNISAIVATEGTMSEGIDIKRIDVLILANFAVSKVTVMQSIGRAIRMLNGKTHAIIMDYILEDSPMLSRHANIRLDYYRDITNDIKIV